MMSVRVFHNTSTEALIQAEEIANAVRQNDRSIPLITEEGIATGSSLEVDKVHCEIIADHIAIITIQWIGSYTYK